MSNAAQPSPEFFFQTINAYQRPAALKAAIELALFTAIGQGARTAGELAIRCEASERGVRILCDYLVIIGLLTKDSAGYGLTPDSAAFLDRRSPGYIGASVQFLLSPMLTDGFRDLAGATRKGGTVMNEQGIVSPENPVWVDFARGMAPLIASAADPLAVLLNADADANCKVLDIAAGHGLFGIAVASRNPNAQIVAVDWPNVLEVALENARTAQVSDRYTTIRGDAFAVNFGSGYHIVLLTNFLHHYDQPTCETLLRKIHAALEPGGRVATLEFVPNEDRVSPPLPAAFSLMMLGSTPGGDAYTFSEFEAMFRNTGFSRNELYSVPRSIQQVIISHK